MYSDLSDIQKPVAPLLEETENILRRRVSNHSIQLIKEINASTPVAEGKMIRSTLLFLLAGLNRSPAGDLPTIGAAIEMLHLSSLIHDDVVDNSERRRGKKTLNTHFGNFVSVLYGDYLFMNAVNLILTTEKAFLLPLLINTAISMTEGQFMEIENTFNYEIDLSTYRTIIKQKTASLFEAVAHIIVRSDHALTSLAEEYRQFGQNFGHMFQIKDDMLDIFSANSGKDRFRDLKEGKITLPVILFLRDGNVGVLKQFSRSDRNQNQLLKLFTNNKIKEQSLSEIERYHSKCRSFLDQFQASNYKTALLDLLDFIKYRDY